MANGRKEPNEPRSVSQWFYSERLSNMIPFVEIKESVDSYV